MGPSGFGKSFGSFLDRARSDLSPGPRHASTNPKKVAGLEPAHVRRIADMEKAVAQKGHAPGDTNRCLSTDSAALLYTTSSTQTCSERMFYLIIFIV